MSVTSPIPWHQYALISYVADKLGNSQSFGRTAMQKLVFLMEPTGVPIGYRYRLYNYGPYSADLASDVTYLETLGGVVVTIDSATNVYRIVPGPRRGDLILKGAEFLGKYQKAIDTVIDRFGQRKARDLELLATTVYLYRQFATDSQSDKRSNLLSQVKAVKPKFSDAEVDTALDELAEQGYIRV